MTATTRDNPPAGRRRTRRSGRRFILILALIAVVAAAAGGGWYFWQYRKAVFAATPPQPIYVVIKPFVVSMLDDNQTTRFVQVGIDLEVADHHAAERVEQALPAIQDAIRLKILQSKLSEVTSPQGVETLRKALIAQANSTVGAVLDPAATPPAKSAPAVVSPAKPASAAAPPATPASAAAPPVKPASVAALPAKSASAAVLPSTAPVRNLYFTELVVE